MYPDEEQSSLAITRYIFPTLPRTVRQQHMYKNWVLYKLPFYPVCVLVFVRTWWHRPAHVLSSIHHVHCPATGIMRNARLGEAVELSATRSASWRNCHYDLSQHQHFYYIWYQEWFRWCFHLGGARYAQVSWFLCWLYSFRCLAITQGEFDKGKSSGPRSLHTNIQ